MIISQRSPLTLRAQDSRVLARVSVDWFGWTARGRYRQTDSLYSLAQYPAFPFESHQLFMSMRQGVIFYLLSRWYVPRR